MNFNESRRKLLKNLAMATGSIAASSKVYTAFLRDGTLAKAAAVDGKFVLYIHCGSWDGIASGLLQPQSTMSWPAGTFENGSLAPAKNPLLMQLSSSEGMIFHRYNKVLSEIIGDLFHATLNPRSLDHNLARPLQQTGHETLHPAWTSAFAEMTRDPDKGPALVAGGSGRVNQFTPNVSAVNALTLAGFVGAFSDPLNSSLSVDVKKGFGAVAKQIYKENLGTSVMPGHFLSAFDGAHRYWAEGIPELASTSPVVKSITDAMAVAKADALIDQYMENDDAAGVKARYSNFGTLRSNLILAGALAKTGLASGMDIMLPGEDLHFGGSQVETARSGCQLWTQLVLFWNWIKAQGLQDKVLVIVSHEFSRTRFNSNVKKVTIQIDGRDLVVDCPGTDHGVTAGMYCLHGKLPGGERLGGVLDSYVAGGSGELGQGPVAGKAAPTSLQVVGTVLMVCFPEIFQNPREPESTRNLRKVCPTIQDSDLILPLLRAGK